ncbi:hypothetical protein BGZ47_006000 [Haplosporangium gracile]|nr:hypothetical protein BGZ47_006000 [Haplosporangium gracile]
MQVITAGASIVAGAALSVVTILYTVGTADFTTGGVVARSWAASFMATYGGSVAVGSACATLQSIGVVGLGAAGNVDSATVGGVAAGVVVVGVDGIKGE